MIDVIYQKKFLKVNQIWYPGKRTEKGGYSVCPWSTDRGDKWKLPGLAGISYL